MPETELTTKGTIPISGKAVPALDAANALGNFWLNDGNTIMMVTNGAGVPQSVIVTSQALCSQGGLHPITVSVPAGETWFIAGFPKSRYNDSSGYCHVTYSAVVTLTVAIFTLGGY